MNTLSDGTTTITFPGGIRWNEEFTWSAVTQAAERTIGGALVLDNQTKTGGCPMTLQSVDADSGWATKASIDQLRTWAQTPGLELDLVWNGVTYPVTMRHYDPPALEVEPVVPFDDPDSTDFYTLTLRLVDITP